MAEQNNAAPAASRGKTWGLCFVVGGLYGVLGQIIWTLVYPACGDALTAAVTLLLLGVVAIVMYIPGIHQKIAAVSGFGSILPFNGFACGVADAYEAGAAAGGPSGGVKAVVKMFVGMVVLGGVIAMAGGLVGAFVKAPTVPMPVPTTGAMLFLTAFITGGCICLLFQIIFEFTHCPVPTLLIIGLALGGWLTMFGITTALGAFGGCGFVIMVIGAGTALYNTTMLAVSGNVVPLLIIWGVFIALAVVGIVCGAGNLKVKGGK